MFHLELDELSLFLFARYLQDYFKISVLFTSFQESR